MQSKKILAVMLAIGMTLTPLGAYAYDGAVVPSEYRTVTAAEPVVEDWGLEDFAIDGTTIIGLSAEGQEKIKKNPDLVLPDKNSSGEDITAIADGTMNEGTFGYKDLSDNKFKLYVPTSVVLPLKLESIGKFAFSGNIDNSTKEQVGLTSVEFPGTLKTIGMCAFQNAPLTEINIPDGVTSIGTGAFTNTGKIKAKKLKLSSNITTIENSTFNSQAIENIVIPEGVTSIGELAFGLNYSKTVSLPSTLTNIGKKAFMYSKFTEVEIPSSLQTLESDAFDKSEKTVLVKVANPNQLTTFADGTGHRIVCDINNKFVTVTADLPEVTYNGAAFEPAVTVSSNGVKLSRDSEYTVDYADNIDAGTASVIVRGVEGSKYCGELTRTFTIAPKEGKTSITLSQKSYVYNGKAQTPDIKVTFDGEEVSADNYDVTYSGSKVNAGTYKITATLKGNYSGDATGSVTIAKAKSAITARATTRTVKKSAVKKKAVTVSSLKVSNAKGKITYKKISGSSKLKINSRTGKITVVKHKCSKKTRSYKIKVKVACAGTSNYKGSSKTITVTVKMK